MRRKSILAAFVAASISCSLPALAAGGTTKPQIHDPKGDWAVASQDILDGTVTASATKIVADLHLAAPPATGVRSDYDVLLYVGCTPFDLHFAWNGGAPGTSASLDEYACTTGDSVSDTLTSEQPEKSFPATAIVTASGVRVIASPIQRLHQGVKVGSAAVTRLAALLIIEGDSTTGSRTVGGDIAVGPTFVLGS